MNIFLGRLSIRQRILIVFLLIVLSSGTLQLLIAGNKIEDMTLEFYQHHLETDALLMSANLAEPLEHYLDGEGTEDLNRSLSAMVREVKHNYRLLDKHYNVLGYSASEGLGAVLRVAETPELAQAKRDHIGADIRPNLSGIPYMHLAVGVTYERETVGYLVLSQPMQPVYSEIQARWVELATATLPVVILVIGGSLWIAHSILRPVQTLNQSALKMADGALDTRIAVVSHDEVGQLAQTFNYMAGQLDALMKTQRDFVSNAAHELRTPLMTVKLRAEALDEAHLSPDERAAYLTEIQHEVNHMAHMVSSLLVLARIDERRSPITPHEMADTNALLNDLARHWRIAAEQAGLEFRADFEPNLPPVAINAHEFRVILDNLLGNAVKYTPQGVITLCVQFADGALTITISDTGLGFTPEQAQHLFERFYRVDTVRGKIMGTGLGLSIVQAIVEQYNGTIKAESAGKDKGSVFSLRLPINTQTGRLGS